MYTKARIKKNAFSVGLCLLLGALMFSACDNDSGDETGNGGDPLPQGLVGTWISESPGESYTITTDWLDYDDGYGGGYGGHIASFSHFTGDAGVIIIKFDEDKKPTYYSDAHWTDPNHFNSPTPCTEHKLTLKGDYHATYFKVLAGSQVQMGGINNAEKPTLDEAKEAFTAGNTGTYISYWGTYTK